MPCQATPSVVKCQRLVTRNALNSAEKIFLKSESSAEWLIFFIYRNCDICAKLSFQEIDFGIGAFTITKARAEAVDFMTPYWEEHLSFIVKLPAANTIMLFINPFKVILSKQVATQQILY